MKRLLQLLVICCAFAIVLMFWMREAFLNDNYVPVRPAPSLERLEIDLNDIRASCGEICNTNLEVEKVSLNKSFKQLKKSVDCSALWTNKLIDKPSTFTPPLREVPDWLLNDYTYGGRVKYQKWYLNHAKLEDFQKVSLCTVLFSPILCNRSFDDIIPLLKVKWNDGTIANFIEMYRNGTLQGNYGKSSVQEIGNLIRTLVPVKDKHVLVIGSEVPWIEAILLAEGAGNITTLEYRAIEPNHPQIKTLLPADLAELVATNQIPNFDAMVTFSSLEHSGLGRYGDQLNPWGDLIAMARAWCVMRPGGRAIVGIPVTSDDTVCFNAHRMYGRVMLSHLFANWRQVMNSSFDPFLAETSGGCFTGFYQPAIVVEKMENEL